MGKVTNDKELQELVHRLVTAGGTDMELQEL